MWENQCYKHQRRLNTWVLRVDQLYELQNKSQKNPAEHGMTATPGARVAMAAPLQMHLDLGPSNDDEAEVCTTDCPPGALP